MVGFEAEDAGRHAEEGGAEVADVRDYLLGGFSGDGQRGEGEGHFGVVLYAFLHYGVYGEVALVDHGDDSVGLIATLGIIR